MALYDAKQRGKKKMYALMSNFKAIHVLNLPHSTDQPLALEAWADKIRHTAKFLE